MVEHFRDEKGYLITQKQFNSQLNRLSLIRRLVNKIIYDSNMDYAESKIWHTLKKELPVCCLEYSNATDEEIKDIVARLKNIGYNVEFVYISYKVGTPSEVRVRLNDNEEGIDYVSY